MVTRSQLLSVLPKPGNTWTMVKSNHDTQDIITQVLAADKENKRYGKMIAEYFRGKDDRESMRNVYDFLRTQMQYRMESPTAQTTKSLPQFISDGYGDCKHFSGFTAAILSNLGVKGVYRFVGYQPGGNPTHVYTVCLDDKGNTVYCDSCLPFFNTQKKFSGSPIDKNFSIMPLYHVSGPSQSSQDTYLGDIEDESYYEESTSEDAYPNQDSEQDPYSDQPEDFESDSSSFPGESFNQPASTPFPANNSVITEPSSVVRARVLDNSKFRGQSRVFKGMKRSGIVTKANPVRPVKPVPTNAATSSLKQSPASRVYRKKKFGVFGVESPGVEYLSYVGCINGVVHVYEDAVGSIFTKVGKAIKKAATFTGQKIKQAAKATAKGVTKAAKATLKAVKKVGLSVPRNTYLLMVRGNIHSFGRRTYDAIQKNPAKMKDFWQSMGGDFNALKSAASSGSSKKAIFGFEDEYLPHVGIAPAAALATAAPIIVAIVPVLSKILGGSSPEQQKVAEEAQAAFENTTGQKISETQFSPENDAGVPAATSNVIYDTNTGTKHDANNLQSPSSGMSKGLVIGLGLLGIGAVVYISQKK